MEQISEIAARWAVRSDAGELSPEQQRELDAWLAADTRHRGAYVRALAQWADLDRLAALNGSGSADNGYSQSIPPCSVGVDISDPDTKRHFTRRQILAAGLSAAAVGGSCLSWLVLRDEGERFSSGIGEVRRISLVDGSTMLLNTDSVVSVQLGKQRRELRLLRGEALFEVAHDKSRPFIVSAIHTAVRAVGTSFAVRLDGVRIDVTVTEGVVEVADSKTMAGLGTVADKVPSLNVKRVAAHQRVVIASETGGAVHVESLAPAAADRQLAWRDGMVSFDGESLGAAVAEINRHNRRQIVIDDPVLAHRPVVGVFRATDLEGFSAAAAAALKARAVSDGDLIRLNTNLGANAN